MAIGVIGCDGRSRGPSPSKQIELLKTFADQAVIAIENVRLFQELQAKTEELAHSVEQLRSLSEVSQAVNSTLDLQEVLSTIVKHAVQLSATDGGSIYEANDERAGFDCARPTACRRSWSRRCGPRRCGPARGRPGGRRVVTDARCRSPTCVRTATSPGAFSG